MGTHTGDPHRHLTRTGVGWAYPGAIYLRFTLAQPGTPHPAAGDKDMGHGPCAQSASVVLALLFRLEHITRVCRVCACAIATCYCAASTSVCFGAPQRAVPYAACMPSFCLSLCG